MEKVIADLHIHSKLSESPKKTKGFLGPQKRKSVFDGLIKFAPCSGLRRKVINVSLSRAYRLASQTPHNVAKMRNNKK